MTTLCPHTRLLVLLSIFLALGACGGGGAGTSAGTSVGSPSGSNDNTGGSSSQPPSAPTVATNVVPVSVEGANGASGAGNPQHLVTAVTVCLPGDATQCQTFPRVVVDTGSPGLRLFSPVTIPLQRVTVPTSVNGVLQSGDLYECGQFAAGFVFGPVQLADVRIGGEIAANIPIQLVNTTLSGGGNTCGQVGGAQAFGFDGILGVGTDVTDCDVLCPASATPSGQGYYGCFQSNGANTCVAVTLGNSQQVTNPATRFPTDDNGLSIQLPAVPAQGGKNVSGTMTFGIGTQGNNQLGSAQIYPPHQYVEMVNGTGTLYGTLLLAIDSGAFTTQIPQAMFPSNLPVCGVFYCPANPVTVTLGVTSGNIVPPSFTFQFTIADPSSLDPNANGFDDVAGPMPSSAGPIPSAPVSLGLPFFYGRTIFVAFTGMNTSGGVGPYYAF